MSNRKLYREIAKKNGVSMKEVKHDMQEALNHAYNNPNANGIIKAHQNQVPKKDEIPTPDEFINYAVKKIKEKENQ